MQQPSHITPASSDDVQAILRELRRMPEAFATLFAPETDQTLHHRPPGGWSAVDIVWHLADHDAFERSERFAVVLSEENPSLPDDHTRFRVAQENDPALTAAEALEFLARERSLVVALLENLSPPDWLRTGRHPHDGERTLLQLADLRGHDREHFEQARAVIASANR